MTMAQPLRFSMLSFIVAITLPMIAFPVVFASAPISDHGNYSTKKSTQVNTIYQFPNGTWLENIAQRQGGHVLATELYRPNLWQVDPMKPANQVPLMVTKVSGKMGLYGVVEVDTTPEVFAFSAGNLSMDTNGSPFVRGSFSIYSIDLTQKKSQNFPLTPTKLADFPNAGVLNGLTFLPASSSYPKGAILSADGITGVIWVLGLENLKSAIWSRDKLLFGCPPGPQGVNGLKYSTTNKRLFFTNSGCGFVASIEVNPRTGQPVGSASIVGGMSQNLDPDDFDVSYQNGGSAFVSDLYQNQIFAVNLVTGVARSIAGSINSTEIAHPTAVKVGRTVNDKKQGTIYVTTTGGLPNGINGQIVGGQVLAIKGANQQVSR